MKCNCSLQTVFKDRKIFIRLTVSGESLDFPLTAYEADKISGELARYVTHAK